MNKKLLISAALGTLSLATSLAGAETFTRTNSKPGGAPELPAHNSYDSRSDTSVRPYEHVYTKTRTETDVGIGVNPGNSYDSRTQTNNDSEARIASDGSKRLWIGGPIAEALYRSINQASVADKKSSSVTKTVAGNYDCSTWNEHYSCRISKIDANTAKVLYGSMPEAKGAVRTLGVLKCGKDNCRFPGYAPAGGAGGANTDATGTSAQ